MGRRLKIGLCYEVGPGWLGRAFGTVGAGLKSAMIWKAFGPIATAFGAMGGVKAVLVPKWVETSTFGSIRRRFALIFGWRGLPLLAVG